MSLHDGTLTAGESNCFTPDAVAQMEQLVVDFGRAYKERNDALNDVVSAHHDALLRLSRAAEFRDDDTGVHIVRIGFLAWALALRLGQSPEWALRLRQAAPMHDIGKIGVTDGVLKKAGAFTSDERLAMNQHPEIGAEILGRSDIPLFQLAAETAPTHHEQWDGNGYPARLAGAAIPLSGRIVAVVDFFDALTMDRCYRGAFSNRQAMEMMQAQSGKALDPHIVDTFIAHADEMVALRDGINEKNWGFAELSGVADPQQALAHCAKAHAARALDCVPSTSPPRAPAHATSPHET